MRQPCEVRVGSRRVDDYEIVVLLDRGDRIGELGGFDRLVVIELERRSARDAGVGGDLQSEAGALGPIAPKLDVAFWRESRSMVATRCPTFMRAAATCIAKVDLPEPPFSLPSTTTCAETGRRVLAGADMTPPRCHHSYPGTARGQGSRADRLA